MSRTFESVELLDRVDNDMEFLGDTIEMLSVDGLALLAEIRRAAAASDAAAIARHGHALKGMISNFCATTTHAAAHEVERIGRSGDLVSLPAALNALEAQMGMLITDLKEFLAARAR